MNCFKKMRNKVLELKEEEKEKQIKEMFEKAAKEFRLIDSKVVIDGDEDNVQFWNGVLCSFEEWCFD